MKVDPKAAYQKIKNKISYDEEVHCEMVLEVMGSRNKGTLSAFCLEAGISDTTFYRWLDAHPVFNDCYQFGKNVAKRNWELEGEELQHLESKEVGCKYELWRLKGWSQFGIGKNSRIRLSLTPGASPSQHYQELLKQAGNGDFTAGEIKQLMEAVNVGLSAHQVFEMQEQIAELKKTLEKMEARSNG